MPLGTFHHLLEGKSIRVSRPDEFNDPFEFLPKFALPDSEQVAWQREAILKQYRISAEAGVLNPEETLTQFSSRPEVVSATKKARQENASTFEARFGTHFAIPYQRMIGREFRVLCMAEEATNALMWAHYSGDHTGVCVGFHAEAKSLKAANPKLGPRVVKYQEHRTPNRGGNDMLSEEEVGRVLENPVGLFTKSKEWHYEKEWRWVYECNDSRIKKVPNSQVEVMPICLDEIQSITMGCRIDYYPSHGDLNSFFDLVESMPPQVERFHTAQCAKTFSLIHVPIFNPRDFARYRADRLEAKERHADL